MSKTRVLIIDKHTAVRNALAVRLRSYADIEIVGSLGNLTEPDLLELPTPDVVVLGISSKSDESLRQNVRAVRLLSQYGIQVLALASYVDDVVRESVLQAGASLYLLKDINTPQLIEEILRLAHAI